MHLEKPETPRRSDRRGTSAFATRGSLREIRTRIRRQQRVQISSSFSVARIFLPPLRPPFPATTLVSLNRACTTSQPGRFLASSRFRCRGYRSRERPMHTVLAIQPIWRTSAGSGNTEIGIFRIILGSGFEGRSNLDGYFDRRGIFRIPSATNLNGFYWTGGAGEKRRKLQTLINATNSWRCRERKVKWLIFNMASASVPWKQASMVRVSDL